MAATYLDWGKIQNWEKRIKISIKLYLLKDSHGYIWYNWESLIISTDSCLKNDIYKYDKIFKFD